MGLRCILYGLLFCLAIHADESSENYETEGIVYTNSWAVQLDKHDDKSADEVAANLGFENRGAISNLPGYFTFVHQQTESRHKRSAEHQTRPLLNHPRVKWAKQQTLLFRYKRGFEAIDRAARYARVKKDINHFDDPGWPKEWYLYDSGFDSASGNLGVLEATKKGYTGKGVVVCIVDDGLDYRHPDLRANYDAENSIDINDEHSYGPLPDDSTLENAHGTKCAGEVAAVADNGICGVGVAYNASLCGIRMLDGTITDAVEARSLGHNCDTVDIKSASWGPKDDGKTFGGPEELTKRVIEECARHGRKGKGSIFVWASGNGGFSQDDCACDGYVSSIYTLSVSSVSPGGRCTYYDEKCPSTMASVYTGDIGDRRENYASLVTTSLHNECVYSFSGTSCAAPLAAGVVALVLQANPELTWRDMQHLVVHTAVKNDPEDPSWSKNAAGHDYNSCYGFGVLNAMSLIEKAKNWEHVGPQLRHEVQGDLRSRQSKEIKSNDDLTLRLDNDDSSIHKLEHVQLVLSVNHRRRGDMVIELTSPQGTTSRLLSRRPADDSAYGLDKWPFMSVQFWGENPRGKWTVKIKDVRSKNNFSPRDNQDILFDEGKTSQKHEPIIQNDLTHGRFKKDYMEAAARSKKNLVEQSEQGGETSFQRELHHGRFKEDYMKLKADSSDTRNMERDESDCSPSSDGQVAGCVTQLSIVLYGTA